MEHKTLIEKISGSLPTTIVTTGIATATSIVAPPVTTIAAALLPVLTSTLAHGRYQQRIESALADLNTQLSQMGDEIQSITDNQYKLISEIVLAIQQSQNDEKIEILKRAVVGGIKIKNILEHEAFVVSRALRDISPVEYEFLIELSTYDEITLLINQADVINTANIRIYQPETVQSSLLFSLTRLDLLNQSPNGKWNQAQIFKLTKTATRLLEICSKK